MITLICSIIYWVMDLYVLAIFIYVIMSWFPHEKGTIAKIYAFLEAACEPYLKLFRKIIPPIGNVDVSPIVAVIVLELVVRLIIGFL